MQNGAPPRSPTPPLGTPPVANAPAGVVPEGAYDTRAAPAGGGSPQPNPSPPGYAAPTHPNAVPPAQTHAMSNPNAPSRSNTFASPRANATLVVTPGPPAKADVGLPTPPHGIASPFGPAAPPAAVSPTRAVDEAGLPRTIIAGDMADGGSHASTPKTQASAAYAPSARTQASAAFPAPAAGAGYAPNPARGGDSSYAPNSSRDGAFAAAGRASDASARGRRPGGYPDAPAFPSSPNRGVKLSSGAFPAAPSLRGPNSSQPAPAAGSIRYPAQGDVLASSRGTYHLGRVVGQGVYGAVYEAFGPFDQRYALKLLVPANRPYVEVQSEWQREAQRLLLLRHPGVVFMHDAFEINYLFYMAFEWCSGSLRDMLGGRPLGPELAIELTRQMLAAVQYLHDNDIVHDDLHPGNVLITNAGRPVVKIADFGISKELQGRSKARPDVVHHAIMAPEVVASGYTSRQSDIYQIGLLLYWMVVGNPPLDYSVPYNDLVNQVANGAPRERAEAIGTPIGAVIAKMLRRRERYRYASCREVWEELRTVPEWQAARVQFAAR